MSRSPFFADFLRLIRRAQATEDSSNPGSARRPLISRRDLLKALGWTAGAAASSGPLAAWTKSGNINVGIVGAGLAGLACADELARAGVRASIYDAATGVGGRCSSLHGYFPGQVAELGGEFIDNLHKTIIGYARASGWI